jgi:uncharacterized protein (DUF2344 family)
VRLRARFTKLGKVRFTSHRDVARMWERALRRAGLPVAYTEGFSPRPKLHFGLALTTGYESRAEFLDVDLATDLATDLDVATDLSLDLATDLSLDLDLDRRVGRGVEAHDGAGGGFGRRDCPRRAWVDRLSAALPEGIDVTGLAVIDPSDTSLQQAVTSCEWRIGVDGADSGRLADEVDRLLANHQLPVTRERKGRRVDDDLRPHILALHADTDAEGKPTLQAELGTQPRAVRPSELVAAFGGDLAERSVCRLHQWITHDGVRREPLAAAVDADRARASGPGR